MKTASMVEGTCSDNGYKYGHGEQNFDNFVVGEFRLEEYTKEKAEKSLTTLL